MRNTTSAPCLASATPSLWPLHLGLPRSFGLYRTPRMPRFQDSEVPSSAELSFICHLCPPGALSPLPEVSGNLWLLLDRSASAGQMDWTVWARLCSCKAQPRSGLGAGEKAQPVFGQ